jgi:hypothetical protein
MNEEYEIPENLSEEDKKFLRVLRTAIRTAKGNTDWNKYKIYDFVNDELMEKAPNHSAAAIEELRKHPEKYGVKEMRYYPDINDWIMDLGLEDNKGQPTPSPTPSPTAKPFILH